ncbi:helix-turn-helix domain-containing protein [Thermoclostridium stercorarium]|uniref:helix-turn-helix transcriptional regulator n=1 Tax=Thermoclostridium stercorarium TaxID=1510 RepID=UPI002248CC87|nr:helix-turn-helix transcriptional regulator [Thermoclostridium stercorarium]UZQ85078.1 helix-turn-helix domain-containing protein [Thermoclostridium stercorarium]
MREWLKNKRIELNKTQEAVAAAVGITQQHYSLIETGERTPSVECAKAIAAILDFDWTKFFEIEQEAS